MWHRGARFRGMAALLLADRAATADAKHCRLRQAHVSSSASGESVGLPMDQTIRFVTTDDGVKLAYAISGSGPPLLKTANWLNHLEYDWESPVWRHWFRLFSSHHTFYRYDVRGSGLSDHVDTGLDFDRQITDLECVVDAAGLETFALLGISQGASVAIEYAARHPERVTQLVLHGGFVQGWAARDAEAERAGRAWVELVRVGWGQETPSYRRLFAELFIPGATPEQMDWFG